MSSSQQAVHLEKLNPAHQAHVNGYLKYFRRRLTASQNEISHAFHDAKEINLTESVYTADEVKEKMESLYTTVKAEIQTEFERYAHQSVLFLCLIFLQAEAQGFSVSIDTSSLDDAQLLDALKNFEVGPRLDIANKKLASINGEIDANLVVRVKDLESEKATLLSRVTRMQEQLIAAQKEATDAKDQAESLKKQTEQLNADLLTAAKSNNSDALASELAAARAAVAAAEKKNAETSADLKKRLDEARAELTGKVQATAQYQQLHKMIQDKNGQLKELRTQVRALQEKLGLDPQ